MADTFVIVENDGPTVIVSPESSGELLVSGSSVTVTETSPVDDHLEVIVGDEAGSLVVTENQPVLTDATSIHVFVSEGGVTGPAGDDGQDGHSVAVTWHEDAPTPDDNASGAEGDLWVVL